MSLLALIAVEAAVWLLLLLVALGAARQAKDGDRQLGYEPPPRPRRRTRRTDVIPPPPTAKSPPVLRVVDVQRQRQHPVQHKRRTEEWG